MEPQQSEKTAQDGNGLVVGKTEDGDDLYGIERVLEHRPVAKRGGGKPVYEYRFKWENWNGDDPTWYPETFMTAETYRAYWEQVEISQLAPVAKVSPETTKRKAAPMKKQDAPKRRKGSNGDVSRPRGVEECDSSVCEVATVVSVWDAESDSSDDTLAGSHFSPERRKRASRKKTPTPTPNTRRRNLTTKKKNGNGDFDFDVEDFLDYALSQGEDLFLVNRNGCDEEWIAMENIHGVSRQRAEAFKAGMLRAQAKFDKKELKQPKRRQPAASMAEPATRYRIPTEALERRLLEAAKCPSCSQSFTASIGDHFPCMSKGCTHSVCLSCLHQEKQRVRHRSSGEWLKCPVTSCGADKAFSADLINSSNENEALMMLIAGLAPLARGREPEQDA